MDSNAKNSLIHTYRTGREDAEEAIKAADSAFKGWSSLTPFERGQYIRKASEMVLLNAQRIATLMTMEQGKPLKEALGEVRKGAEILRYYAEEGERVYGRIIPNAESNIESRVIYQPVGVAAAISPWNYPVELLAWKVGGALAAGCTIVAKVPSETPLSPIAFVRCITEAGIPDGVVNLITGSGSDIGPVLTGSPLVKKVAFTGSTKTGREVLKSCADTFKCDLGPMTTAAGVEKAIRHINDALRKGAKIVCGGKKPEGDEYKTNIKSVLCLIYGLAAIVFTESL